MAQSPEGSLQAVLAYAIVWWCCFLLSSYPFPAAYRLNHLRHSNADLERCLKSVDWQILIAQRAVQQLVS